MYWTLWPSLTDTTNPTLRSATWNDFVAQHLKHKLYSAKHRAPGFGPYKLKYGATTRAEASVESISMAVFDADQGKDEKAIYNCTQLLDNKFIAYALYSSWSYPDKPAFRLVIPFLLPLDPYKWPSVRAALIEKFAIPAHPDQCKGASHFYYLPSTPDLSRPLVNRITSGPYLDPNQYADWSTSTSFSVRPKDFEFAPPAEPAKPENLNVYRAWLTRRAKRDHDAAPLIEALLQGRALAESGERNDTTTRATGMLAWMFPDAPLSTLVRLIKPSVEAMQAEGSKLTWKQVESMFLRAMKRRAYKEAEAEAFLEEMTNHLTTNDVSEL